MIAIERDDEWLHGNACLVRGSSARPLGVRAELHEDLAIRRHFDSRKAKGQPRRTGLLPESMVPLK
ncbi:hypothetical protein [Aromatoleum evansii]|uniref:hypothetical protein n=1 Tax=Aromatoleum evansii TaxID=59406 RepID=UPI00145EF98A|nr:hypothetical protein [Aromatoleum evansii]NMG29905.1 hypothetical protein [Aromatoleum evansii]